MICIECGKDFETHLRRTECPECQGIRLDAAASAREIANNRYKEGIAELEARAAKGCPICGRPYTMDGWNHPIVNCQCSLEGEGSRHTWGY